MNFEKKNSIYKIIMLIIVTALITFLVSSILFYNYYLKTDKGNISALSKYISLSDSTTTLEKKIEILKKYLEEEYMGDLNDEKMIQGALKGYVEGLGDKYTEYLTEDDLEELMISVSGNYVGIGVYMTKNTNGEIIVLLPIEGSPAEEMGVEAGDIILKIDGEECSNLELSDVANMVKGEEGTKVNIEFERKGEAFSLEIERRKVELKYMDSKVLDDNIGYIQMVSFEEGCSEKFKDEIEKLKDQNVKSIIVDMRDNGGGLVTEAIAISEIFAPNGTILLRSYDKDNNETIKKSTALSNEDIEFVVLVNENSASATEIFAAAMKDNNIAKIIGTQTFGKGVMQEVKVLDIGGALKITVEVFKTPNGDEINDVGIEPDIVVENESEEEDIQLQTAIDYLKK